MNSIQQARIKRASQASLAGLLNLTFLPITGFIYLLVLRSKIDVNQIDDYHTKLAIKINIIAAVALLFVSGVIIFFGGFESVYTWMYVIVYFTFVHSIFILVATWALVAAWSGKKIDRFKL